LDILEEIRRKCIKEEGFTTRMAMDRVLVLRRIEAFCESRSASGITDKGRAVIYDSRRAGELAEVRPD
jgi:hypothetical protein